MIRRCDASDVAQIMRIVNDAAVRYRGVIPADRWHEPYMPIGELREEIEAGVRFFGYEIGNELAGVMGLQHVRDVALIRHAYTLTSAQGKGVGSALLAHVVAQAHRPLLVGTWKAATWAIRFYEKRGFTLVSGAEKDDLLKRYWKIPDRQIETSVVLRH